MKTSLKHGVWILAVVVGMGVSVGTARALAAPFQQDHEQQHEQDYSKNRTYQQGMREGRNDHARSMDHSRKRHFKKDVDNKAYEAGYQKGRGN